MRITDSEAIEIAGNLGTTDTSKNMIWIIEMRQGLALDLSCDLLRQPTEEARLSLSYLLRLVLWYGEKKLNKNRSKLKLIVFNLEEIE